MRRALTGSSWVWILAVLGGCTPSASIPGPGLHQRVRVSGAQLRRGDLGAEDGGPEVSLVVRPQPLVRRGESGIGLSGRLAPGGVALHVQAVGDPDHWVLPAGGFDFVVEDELQFAAELEVSHAVQEEEIRLQLAASDASGRLGPVRETTLTLSEDLPAARLLVSLGWDRPVDMDLWVVDADGVAIGAKNIASVEPPVGQPVDPDAWQAGGVHDYDANQHCQIDARNREDVYWLQDPPPGEYRIYAHLYAPCGEAAVNAVALVQRDGETLLRAGATQYAFDAREHGDAIPPGLWLATFEVP